MLAKRSSASVRVASSGTIINTLGWVEGLGYELQVHAIQALKVGGWRLRVYLSRP